MFPLDVDFCHNNSIVTEGIGECYLVRHFYNNYIYIDYSYYSPYQWVLHGSSKEKERYFYGILYINLEDDSPLIIPFVGAQLFLSIEKLINRIGNYQPSIYDIEGLFMK